MSREIRQVAAAWHHPLYRVRQFNGHSSLRFRPLLRGSYEDDRAEWANEDDREGDEFWAAPEAYMPQWTDADKTHFQIYETVSEGTPCSPVFATRDEMATWMQQPIDWSSPYNGGADWQCMQGKDEATALAFCKVGWAPSMVATPETGIMSGVDALSFIAKEKPSIVSEEG